MQVAIHMCITIISANKLDRNVRGACLFVSTNIFAPDVQCRRSIGPGAENASQETFALFMRPDASQVIGENETFGSFSKKVFSVHHVGTGVRGPVQRNLVSPALDLT